MKTQLLPMAVCTFRANDFLSAVRCVNENITTPTPPDTNWATASASVHTVADPAVAGDEIVVSACILSVKGTR